MAHPRWSLALLALAVFAVVFTGGTNVADTTRRLQVTHWIWHGDPQVAPDDINPWMHLPGKNGETYAPYGIGQSIVMLPADILATILVEHGLGPRIAPATAEKIESFVVSFLTFSLLTIVNVILSYDLLILVGFATAEALSATALLLIGSSFLMYVQTTQENSGMYLCFVGALVCGLKAMQGRARRYLLLAGALVGFSLLFKVTDLAFAPPLYLLFVWVRLGRPGGGTRPTLRQAAAAAGFVALYFGAAVLAGLALDRFYEWCRFGDLAGTYIHVQAIQIAKAGGWPPNYPFDYDFFAGFAGPFVARSKSIFIFDPMLLALAALLACYWRRLDDRVRAVVATATGTLLLIAAFFAGTYWWPGDGAWGPRHHQVPVEVLCLVAFALAVRHFREWPRPAQAALSLVALLSLGVQLIALPKTYGIEVMQLQQGDPLHVVPAMRIRNLAAILSGDFHERGLDYGNPEIMEVATAEAENRIFVFRLGSYISHRMQAILIGLWAALAALTIAGLGIAIGAGFARAGPRPGAR